MFSVEHTVAFDNVATAQEGCKEWLEKYGLTAHGVGRDKVLCALDRCRAKKNREAYKTLHTLESKLLRAMSRLRARLEWLDSGSRHVLGAVSERSAVLLLCSVDGELAHVRQLLSTASCLLLEQFSAMKYFNVICCIGDMHVWENAVVEATADRVQNAVEWVEHLLLLPSPESPRCTIFEGVTTALNEEHAECVYMLVSGRMCSHDYSKLQEQLKASPRPLHIVICGNSCAAALCEYEQLASASGGRCHTWGPGAVLFDSHFTPSRSVCGDRDDHSLGTESAIHTMASTCYDLQLVCKELDTARSLLAEVHTLQLEATMGWFSVAGPADEPYITSEEWLMAHGMHSRRLMFEDLVSSLAFNHCGGVVRASSLQQTADSLPGNSGLRYTRYCKDFVHLRHKDHIIHVQLGNDAFQQYKAKLDDVIKKYRERLELVIGGSRALFGTILEQRIVIILDTSSSMAGHLDFVKGKMKRLIQEQLAHTEAFTVVQFHTSITCWREGLVPSNQSNLLAMWQWVRGMQAGGSTNTLGALLASLRVPNVQALYLLTDGRPDQPVEAILAKVQQRQQPGVIVNTISFNCVDPGANHFLEELARVTGGRYHCFRGDLGDDGSPACCENADIQKVRDELTLAQQQLAKAAQLHQQCRELCEGGGASSPVPRVGVRRTTHAANLRSFQSSERWLRSNNLSAKKLTPADICSLEQPTTSQLTLTVATATGAVNAHNSSPTHKQSPPTPPSPNHHHAPLILPSSAHQCTPLKPPSPSSHEDLEGYKGQLERQIEAYWSRLSCLAWHSLPPQVRVKVRSLIPRGKPSSYRHNRALLHKALSEANWPCPQENFILIEEQISQAQSYLEWCISLMEEKSLPSLSSKRPKASRSAQSHSASPLTATRVRSRYMSHLATSRMKGQVVVARSDIDRLYYPSVVLDYVRTCQVTVQFADGRQQLTNTCHVFPIGGKAALCHTFQPGDCVLVGLGTSMVGLPMFHTGTRARYVPGIVEAVDSRRDTAPQNIVTCRVNTFGCHGIVTTSRKQLIKIPYSCYAEACRSVVDGTGKRTQARGQYGRIRSRSWHESGLQECWKSVLDKEVGTVWSFTPSQEVKEAFKTSEKGPFLGTVVPKSQHEQMDSKVKQQLTSEGQENERERSKQGACGVIRSEAGTAIEVQDKPQRSEVGTAIEVQGKPQRSEVGTAIEVQGKPQKSEVGTAIEVQDTPQSEANSGVQGEAVAGGRVLRQEGPQGVQDGPQGVQDVPQEVQDGPQGVQEGPQGVQEGTQGVQEGPQGVQEGPQKIKTTVGDNAVGDMICDNLPVQPGVEGTSVLHPQPVEVWRSVSSLEKQLDNGMQQLGGHLDQLGGQVDQLGGQVGQLGGHLDQLGGQVASLLSRQVKVDEMLQRLVSEEQSALATMGGRSVVRDAFLPSPVGKSPEVASQAVMAVVDVYDQSVNTESSKEDRVVGTDPITESRGVGTEWYDSVNSSLACQHCGQQALGSQTSHYAPLLASSNGRGIGRGSGTVQSCGSCVMNASRNLTMSGSCATKGGKKRKIRIKSLSSMSSRKANQVVPVDDCQVVVCDVKNLQVNNNQQEDGQVGGSRAGGDQVVGSRAGDDQVRGSRSGDDQVRGNRAGDDQVRGSRSGDDQVGGSRAGDDQVLVLDHNKVMIAKRVEDVTKECNMVDKCMVGVEASGETAISEHNSTHLGMRAPPATDGAEARLPSSTPLAKATQTEHKGTIVGMETEPLVVGQAPSACSCVVGPSSKLDTARDTISTDSHHTAALLVGQTVLARWPDRGWYYWARVLRCEEGGAWYLLEAEGDTETIHSSDIVIRNSPVPSSFKVGDTVLACHPSYEGCHVHVPGHITEVNKHQVIVCLYDDALVQCSAQDVYPLSPQKHQEDLRCIVEREHSLVGKVVIARRDSDGLFYPGKVLKHLAFPQVYLIGWKSGSTQEQSGCHLFGPMTKRHSLKEGDGVLALASTSYGMCMPGQVVGTHKGKLEVEFCDGQNQLVPPTYCFRITKKYYEAAVEYIALKVQDELQQHTAEGR